MGKFGIQASRAEQFENLGFWSSRVGQSGNFGIQSGKNQGLTLWSGKTWDLVMSGGTGWEFGDPEWGKFGNGASRVRKKKKSGILEFMHPEWENLEIQRGGNYGNFGIQSGKTRNLKIYASRVGKFGDPENDGNFAVQCGTTWEFRHPEQKNDGNFDLQSAENP